MAGNWKLESHIKLLYCLHFITLWILALCLAYIYLVSSKTSFCLHHQEQIGPTRPLNPGNKSGNDREKLDTDEDVLNDDNGKEESSWKLFPSSSSTLALTSKERTKRNPISNNNEEGQTTDTDSHLYQYSLKELLALEKEKPYDKSKRKRIKLRIMFNESDHTTQQDNYEPPLTSDVNDPTIVSLPSESADPWLLNYLKDFCFSLNDFCVESSNGQSISSTSKGNFDEPSTYGATVSPKSTEAFNYNESKFPSTFNKSEDYENQINSTDQSTASNASPVAHTTSPGFAPSIGFTSSTAAMVADKDVFNYYDDLTEETTAGTTNRKISHISRKRKRCYVNQIGKPVEVGFRKTFYGAWMRDARPRFEHDEDKRYVTEHFNGISLLEYSNEDDLYKPELSPVKTYTLPHMYDGTNHVILNGAIIYHRSGTRNIIRYDLYRNYTKETVLKGAAYGGGSSYLYEGSSFSYFDFAVDENALWVIYRFENEKFLSVSRLHPKTLKILRTWNLTEIDANSVGNSWITCGVIYLVKSATLQNTTLYFAYDLYARKYAQINNMEWTNVYNDSNMIAYNPKDRKVYVYDHGHLIMVPMLLYFDVR